MYGVYFPSVRKIISKKFVAAANFLSLVVSLVAVLSLINPEFLGPSRDAQKIYAVTKGGKILN